MEKCSHKLRNLLLFICLVAFSTLTFSCADDKKEDLTGLITYFKIKVNNEVFEGTIDEGTRRISFQGIKSISGITDVEYQLKTGASIYPSPETRRTVYSGHCRNGTGLYRSHKYTSGT